MSTCNHVLELDIQWLHLCATLHATKFESKIEKGNRCTSRTLNFSWVLYFCMLVIKPSLDFRKDIQGHRSKRGHQWSNLNNWSCIYSTFGCVYDVPFNIPYIVHAEMTPWYLNISSCFVSSMTNTISRAEETQSLNEKCFVPQCRRWPLWWGKCRLGHRAHHHPFAQCSEPHPDAQSLCPDWHCRSLREIHTKTIWITY